MRYWKSLSWIASFDSVEGVGKGKSPLTPFLIIIKTYKEKQEDEKALEEVKTYNEKQ